MLKQISAFFLSLIFIFNAFLLPSYAVGNTTAGSGNTNIASRCSLITSRVNLIVSRYDANKEKHIQRYERIRTRVSDLIKKLENKGYDLTELKNDLAQLTQLNTQFAQEYSAFIGGLKESKDFACGNSEGQFKGSIDAAKAHLRNAKEISLQIRTLINTEIKADLKALKDQIKNK